MRKARHSCITSSFINRYCTDFEIITLRFRLGEQPHKVCTPAAHTLVEEDVPPSGTTAKQLEIVIATYEVDRMEESARIWERMLAIPKASLP